MLAGDVIITEFMASNTRTLLDQDNEYSDWIELQNTSANSVNLNGWYLTDTAALLTEWKFPSTTIPAGGFLKVFASGKDRAVAGSELHTNFKLDTVGEYLALVQPDGVTISSEFATYPQQYDDFSYGSAPIVTTTQLVTAGATGKLTVPAGDLGANWNGENYDDSSWNNATMGVGFDTINSSTVIPAYTNAAGSVGTQFTNTGSMGQDFAANHPITVTHLGVFDSGSDGLKRTLTAQLWARNSTVTPATGVKLAELQFTPGDPGVLINGNRFKALATPLILPAGTYSIVAFGYGGSAGAPATSEPNGNEATGGPGAAQKSTNAGNGSLTFERTRYSLTPGSFPSSTVANPFYFSAATLQYTPSPFVADIATNVQAAMNGVNATAYMRIPFNVSSLVGTHVLTLNAKYDDGFVAYINGTEVARSSNVVGAPSWNSSTGGNERPDIDALTFQSIDISSFFNLLHVGTNVLAVQGLNASAANGDFLLNVALQDQQTFGTSNFYFATPTPGAVNALGYSALSAAPTANNPSGAYGTSVAVTLTAAPGAQIRYTTDGSEPTANSFLYSAPLTFAIATRLRMRAYEPGKGPSPTVSNFYTILAADVAGFNSNLPLVVIDTFTGSINGTTAITTNMTVIDTVNGGRSQITGAANYAGAGSIKIRGSSSSGDAKKPYAVETRTGYGFDNKVGLLDFPAESDWILFAGYGDLTLTRDVLSYQWGNEAGQYASRTRYVELYINSDNAALNAADYQGVYVLMEKIKRDPNRVDIQKLLPTDNTAPNVTGGFIFKNDRPDPGDAGFTSPGGQPLKWVEPKEQEVTAAQKNYLIGYLGQFEAALNGPNFTNPLTGYAAYADVDSFIEMHIMVELTKNIDGYRLSTYFYKDRNGKIVAGPIWDYDRSLGNANYLGSQDPTGWYYTQIAGTDYPWWPRMFQDPNFQQKYIDKWQQLRANEFSTPRLMADIDARAAQLAEAQVRNFAKWGGFSATNTWSYNPKPHPNYAEAISDLKNWTTARVAWMDSNWTLPPTANQNGGAITPGFNLTLAAPQGTIYYTLNGSDPRASGGAVAAGALTYSGPVTLNQGVHLMARAFVAGKGWSSPLDESFFVELPKIVVTELDYHPHNPPAGSPYTDEDFEFLEIQNVGATPVNLQNMQFINGVQFTFPAGPDLAPGQYAVIVRNQTAFATRYPGVAVRGQYVGGLDNNGETVRLVDSLGNVVEEFTYLDTWYPTTDGAGPTLVAVNPSGQGINWSLAASWKPSVAVGGSPGLADGSVVSSRKLFYNNSKFDGNSGAAGVSDDTAIASDKSALLPGGTATFANYSSYSRGINGVMVDIQRVPGSPTLTAADFAFRVGNDNSPGAWGAAPAPASVSVRSNGGGAGVDRVTITWADGAIVNNWLQVTMLANVRTGLAANDVFYFGNAVGETGNSPANAQVNSSDETAVRNNPKTFLDLAVVGSQYDFNRDGLVNATDQLLARVNATTLATALKLISVPASLASASPADPLPQMIDPLSAALLAAGLTAPARGEPALQPRPILTPAVVSVSAAPSRTPLEWGMMAADPLPHRDPPVDEPESVVAHMPENGGVDDDVLELVVIGRLN